MTKALWLNSDQMGCGVYRCYVPALSLQDTGQVDNEFLLHGHCQKEKYTDLDGKDVVVFQRAVSEVFVDWMKECQRRGIRTVFELDDDLFHIAKHSPAAWFWHSKAVQRALRTELALVDHIICSTRPLLELVQQEMGWKDQSKFSLCHNHLHPAVWGPDVLSSVMPYPNQSLVIGWQGSTTHDVDFKEAIPALKRILAEYPHVMLRLLGSIPLSLQHEIPEARFQWSKGVEFHKYPTTLRFVNFDIGIAPITNSRFNRGKSNIKWLEYAALGIPCVASAVYPYARSITHGETGYLATTADEWYTALRALVESAELRRQIGQQARQHVWTHWAAPQHAPSWMTALGIPERVAA